MKKTNKFIIFLSVLSVFATSVQATPIVVTTKDSITLTDKYSTEESGQLYAIDVYDESYTAENPYPSLIYRNQGVSGTDGLWNMSIPMSNEEYGVYRVAAGEATGVYSAFNALYDGFDGEKTYSNVDIQDDKSMKLGASSYILTDFPELIANKVVNISFDISIEENSQVILSLSNCLKAADDETRIFDVLSFGADGKLGLFTKDNNGTLASDLFSCEYGKKYHIDLDIDMLKYTLNCYINNELFGTMSLNDGLKNLGGFKISCSQGGATLSDLESMVSEVDADERLSVNVKSKAKVGNIYFDESKVGFDVSVLYVGLSDATYKVRYEIYNEENGVLIGEETEELSFAADEKKEFVKTFDFNKFDMKYGMFELKLAFEYIGSNAVYKTDGYRFSIAKEAKQANSKLGIHTQFGHGYADTEINTYLMKKSGFSGIRDYLAYTQCFANGEWSEPSRYNNWVDDVKNNNLSQIIEFPTEDIGFPKTEAETEKYVKYAVAVVENLTKDGVYMYELGNELNWTCTAEEYANLLIKVAPAIHNVDKENVKILAFAVAGVNNFHSVNWIINVINIIKEKGLDPHDYIDYITVHPYKPLNQYPEKAERTCTCTYGTESYPELTAAEKLAGKEHPDPKDTVKGDSSLVARMNNLHNRLEEVECEDIPVIATEIGWYSYEGASSQTDCEKCVAKEVTSLTENGQAQYTLRATALLYNKLDKIYYHTLNNKLNSAGTMEKNFGFTENWKSSETEIPYEAKPVFIAMSNFNAMLANAALVKENVSGQNYDYVFSKDGKTIHMLWTTETEQEYTLNTSSNIVKMYDMYGNDKTLLSENGSFGLTLTGSPVYIEETENVLELSLEDENGNEVKKLNCDKIKAKILSDKTITGSLYLVCAAYKDDYLSQVKFKEITEWSGLSYATELLETEDADSVRAFFWTDKLEPLSEFVEVKK